MRSSIFAEYTVRHFLKPEETSSCVVDAALAAADRKTQRIYRVLLSNLLQYSSLHWLFRNLDDALAVIVAIYERLRHDERINEEPLYWLQYAIAVAEEGNLDLAQDFIDTAYNRAALRPGYQTFQIDTQAFRILLLIETRANVGQVVKRVGEIIERLELFNTMLSEDSHRTYVLNVLEHIGPFVQRRYPDLTQPEKVAIVFWLSRIGNTLEGVPAEYKARVGSMHTKEILDAARETLIRLQI